MRLALIGCGLLGGSLAAAWRRHAGVSHVIGFDLDPAQARRACSLGICDAAAISIGAAVAGADCVVLATPVGAMSAVLEDVARHAPAGAIITDVGSTKAALLQSAADVLGTTFARFVAAHPIAGGERPGIEHASASLFQGRWVVTTPDARTDQRALAQVEANWIASGAVVERMPAEEHDRIFAAVSHLPHLLAFALVHQIAGQTDGARKMRYAGAGFRDFTRIAASDPAMWRDIALANRASLGVELAQFRAVLEQLQQAVEAGDAQALLQVFEHASRARREHNFAAAAESYDD